MMSAASLGKTVRSLADVLLTSLLDLPAAPSYVWGLEGSSPWLAPYLFACVSVGAQ